MRGHQGLSHHLAVVRCCFILKVFAFVSAPLNIAHLLHSCGSLLNNNLGESADAIVASASQMPQMFTLCGIAPGQTDINFSNKSLREGDAKLLAFDLSKNQSIKTVKYARSNIYLAP